MKDHKQEAIEILRELTVWDIQSEGYPNLEEFYNRIAPYMVRGFPERIIREGATSLKDNVIVVYFNNLKDVERDINALVEEYLTDFKRLWEDQEPPGGDNILEQEKPKGTCQACGETKKVCVARCPEIFGASRLCENCGQVELVDCPSCDSPGECQHKGNQGWLDADNKTGPPKCLDCGAEVDRRTLPDRRKAGSS